jgi:hypothetical protein
VSQHIYIHVIGAYNTHKYMFLLLDNKFEGINGYILLWIFTISILFFAVCERIVNLLCVFVIIALGKGDVMDTVAATQFAVALFGAVNATFNIVLTVVHKAAVRLFSTSLYFLGLSVVAICIYTIFEIFPESVILFTDIWNQTIGPGIQVGVMVPLQLLSDILGSMVPLYNTFIWIWSKLFRIMVRENAIQNAELIPDLALGVASIVRTSALSSIAYLQTIRPCALPLTNECFDTSRRTFDLIGPLGAVRKTAIPVVQLAKNLCLSASGVLDITLYPLFDINFAYAAHNLVNFVLYTSIQMPMVTYQRCKMYTGGQVTVSTPNVVYCLPDLQPSVLLLVNGLRYLGSLLDNWIDVTSIIVQGSLGFTIPSCDQFAPTLTAVNSSAELFGSNETTLVGIDDGLYALTDGYNVQYFNHRTQRESILHSNAWPIAVVGSALFVFTYTLSSLFCNSDNLMFDQFVLDFGGRNQPSGLLVWCTGTVGLSMRPAQAPVRLL